MGTLSLNQEQQTIGRLLEEKGDMVSMEQVGDISTEDILPLSNAISADSAPTSLQTKRVSWTPSDGKKLETGLAIVLENVVAGFQHPNILDVKLGARLWADDAPTAKRLKLDDVSKETTSSSLGFRITGMKVWMGNEPQTSAGADVNIEEIKDGYKSFGKSYGRAFKADNVRDAFVTYLGGREPAADQSHLKRKRGKLLARRLLRELESMQFALEHEESRMYSASILMVYEGNEEALERALAEERFTEDENGRDGHGEGLATANPKEEVEEEEEEEELELEEEHIPKVHEVRLIDFAHARWTPGQGPDENALQGIRSVVKILKDLAADQVSP